VVLVLVGQGVRPEAVGGGSGGGCGGGGGRRVVAVHGGRGVQAARVLVLRCRHACPLTRVRTSTATQTNTHYNIGLLAAPRSLLSSLKNNLNQKL